jgi:phosphatidate cytidylyltransferase
VTRILSALVLLTIVVGTVWFLPPIATLVLACVVSVLAFAEYAELARALDARVPRVLCGAAVMSACIAVTVPGTASLVMMALLILLGGLAVAHGVPSVAVLRDTAASVLAVVYIGVPLGALAAVRSIAGREAVLLLMAVIVISDSAQYYTGRAFGRRPLAPEISPKKTKEGALGGLVFGTAAMAAGGYYVLHASPTGSALVGASVVIVGIVGDLFESLLKRSAGAKDSSNLIPGHGGVLDRIDSWLFAAPVYYVFVLRLQ